MIVTAHGRLRVTRTMARRVVHESRIELTCQAERLIILRDLYDGSGSAPQVCSRSMSNIIAPVRQWSRDRILKVRARVHRTLDVQQEQVNSDIEALKVSFALPSFWILAARMRAAFPPTAMTSIRRRGETRPSGPQAGPKRTQHPGYEITRSA